MAELPAHGEIIDRAAARAVTVGGYANREDGANWAPETGELKARWWGVYDRWCRSTGRSPMPTSNGQLADFAAHLAQDVNMSPGTLEIALGAVKSWNRVYQGTAPDSAAARSVVRAHETSRELRGLVDKRVAPLEFSDLMAIAGACDPLTAEGQRDLMLVTGLWELAVPGGLMIGLGVSRVSVDADSGLPRVRVAEDGSRPLALRHWDRADGWSGASCPGVCPVEAMNTWLATLEALGDPGGTLVRAVDKNQLISGAQVASGRRAGHGLAMKYNSLQAWWYRVCARGGVDRRGRGLSLTSLRLGGVLAAYARAGDAVAAGARCGLEPETVLGHAMRAGLVR